MNSEVIIWLVLIVLFIFVELIANNLMGVAFVVGALAALLFLYLFGVSLNIQIIVFVLVSVILLFSTRKIVRKINKSLNYKTNTDAVIGKKGKVLVKIEEFSPGIVKIDSLEWSAISKNNASFEVGDIVEVVEVKGVKVVVK